MAIREYIDSWYGHVSVLGRKQVYGKTSTGGYYKALHKYMYECNNCGYITAQVGLIKLHKTALKHQAQAHSESP